MKISHSGERFELAFRGGADFYVDLAAAKAAGFAWDRESKTWWTVDPAVALRLKGSGATATMEAVKLIAFAEAQAAQAIVQSRATDSDAEIPCPVGLAYLSYQKAGIAYATHHDNTLIADEMGLGKTIQGIGISNSDPLTHRVLIICPASLKLNWRREWQKWDIKSLSVGVVGYKKDKEPFEADVVIINYELLGKFNGAIRGIEWDLMLVDECHKLKNPKTARTKQVFGAKRPKDGEPIRPILARRRVYLTGTPIINKPIELFGLLHNIDPQGLGANFMKYALRYCAAVKGYFGWDFSGASNLEELQEQLRARLMVRRLKADVLKELPPKRRQVVVLESNARIDKLIAKEKQSYEEYESAKGEDAQTPTFANLSKARLAVALAKVPFAIEYIQEALDETPKIVIFGHHHEVLDTLEKSFAGSCVRVDGRIEIQARQNAVDRFQTDPTCKVFLGGIQAAGTGLTLTAASLVVFIELDWTPGNISQAEDRLHRIGQKDAVQVQHLVLEGSLDERMIEIILEKQKIIDQALDTSREKGELYV